MSDAENLNLAYPIIVKPVDRSGSRCITKLQSPQGLEDAVCSAIDVSFSKACVVEEFFAGIEYSVEFITEGRASLSCANQKVYNWVSAFY